MSEKISKTQRWLDLIAYLLGRRLPVAIEDIMEAVPSYAAAMAGGDGTAIASAKRMFERDKDELREMGIPLKTTKYSVDGLEQLGYSLPREDFYLPYLKLLEEQRGSRPDALAHSSEVPLSPGEARVAFDAVQRVADLPAFPYATEARSAFRKLAFDLKKESLSGSKVLWVDPPGTEELLERLKILSDALLAKKRVRFAYRGIHRGETTARDVAGYGLFFHRDWYLVGHDATRDALRVFRVARMDDPEPNTSSPKQPDYQVPADFRLNDYLHRDAWELGAGEEKVLEAEVLFHFPASILAERNGSGELVEERPDGSSVRRFEVQQVDPFLRWVMTQAGEAEVTGPAELRGAMREMVDRVSNLYREEAENG
jgi:predicted DNA-binding transcriptional regulator YafY